MATGDVWGVMAVDEARMDGVIRRNTVVLSGCMTLSWAVVQLAMTIGAPILSELTGRPVVAGVAPAIFIASWAVATLGAGRYMDARGRIPGIRLGFAVGAAGCVLMYAGADQSSPAAFVGGISLLGAGSGAVNLARAAAADMYPRERRARGISYVLVGAAFGAILGPVAFTPLLVRVGGDLDVLALPWLVAALVMAAGAALTAAMRVDPLTIARVAGPTATDEPPVPARPLGEMLREAPVRFAIVAALVSQMVMTSMMSIAALVLRHHGHRWTTVTISMSAHFLGMFGLVLVAGQVVDRLGRRLAAMLGLVVMAAGVLAMLGEIELAWVAPAMFAIGLGWNLAFVAATTMLADATSPVERGRLLGFADFAALGTASVGALLAGVMLDGLGLGALVSMGATLALLPLIVLGTGLGRPAGTVRTR